MGLACFAFPNKSVRNWKNRVAAEFRLKVVEILIHIQDIVSAYIYRTFSLYLACCAWKAPVPLSHNPLFQPTVGAALVGHFSMSWRRRIKDSSVDPGGWD